MAGHPPAPMQHLGPPATAPPPPPPPPPPQPQPSELPLSLPALIHILRDCDHLTIRYGSTTAACARLDELERANADMQAQLATLQQKLNMAMVAAASAQVDQATAASAQALTALHHRPPVLDIESLLSFLQRHCACRGNLALLHMVLQDYQRSLQLPKDARFPPRDVLLSIHEILPMGGNNNNNSNTAEGGPPMPQHDFHPHHPHHPHHPGNHPRSTQSPNGFNNNSGPPARGQPPPQHQSRPQNNEPSARYPTPPLPQQRHMMEPSTRNTSSPLRPAHRHLHHRLHPGAPPITPPGTTYSRPVLPAPTTASTPPPPQHQQQQPPTRASGYDRRSYRSEPQAQHGPPPSTASTSTAASRPAVASVTTTTATTSQPKTSSSFSSASSSTTTTKSTTTTAIPLRSKPSTRSTPTADHPPPTRGSTASADASPPKTRKRVSLRHQEPPETQVITLDDTDGAASPRPKRTRTSSSSSSSSSAQDSSVTTATTVAVPSAAAAEVVVKQNLALPLDKRNVVELKQSSQLLTLATLEALNRKAPWDDFYQRRATFSHILNYHALDERARKWFIGALRVQFVWRREFWERLHWLPMSEAVCHGQAWEKYRQTRKRRANKAIAAWRKVYSDSLELMRDRLLPEDVWCDVSLWYMPSTPLYWLPTSSDLDAELDAVDSKHPVRCYHLKDLQKHPFYRDDEAQRKYPHKFPLPPPQLLAVQNEDKESRVNITPE